LPHARQIAAADQPIAAARLQMPGRHCNRACIIFWTRRYKTQTANAKCLKLHTSRSTAVQIDPSPMSRKISVTRKALCASPPLHAQDAGIPRHTLRHVHDLETLVRQMRGPGRKSLLFLKKKKQKDFWSRFAVAAQPPVCDVTR
jgi:hypothetical protein